MNNIICTYVKAGNTVCTVHRQDLDLDLACRFGKYRVGLGSER